MSLTIEYAPFLVMQWLRTRAYRDTIHEVSQKVIQSLADELAAANYPDPPKLKAVVGDQGIAALQSMKIFDRESVERMADELERHFWVVGINTTNHPFYTSDNPVVRRGHTIFEGKPLVGVRDPGVEFAFPLDSTHLLLILERTHFAACRQHDNRSIPLLPEQVSDYNGLQVMKSYQRVYCAADDFDVAREVCAAHPEIRDPKRPRITVENTPIVDLNSEMWTWALE